MRFVVAGVAAVLFLMLDFDALPERVSPKLDPVARISSAFEIILGVAPPSLLGSAGAEEQSVATIYVASIEEPRLPIEPLQQTVIETSPGTSEDEFCRVLKEAAEASEIPVAFFARLIWQESGFRSTEVSHAGAQGVAQFMPETAAEVGLDNPFDPVKALPASARLLNKLREQFGNLGLAAAAYNAGAGRVQRWLARESGLPRETRDYVRIITGTAAESWTAEARTASMRLDLPREAPCEGVGGLSKSQDFVRVPVLLAPAMSVIIKKAEAAEARAAKLKTDRARKRMALRLKLKTRTDRTASAKHATKLRTALGARRSEKGGQRGRVFRVASQ